MPAAPGTVKSAYGNRPNTSLPDPVPGAGQSADMDAALAHFDAPKMGAEGSAPADPSRDPAAVAAAPGQPPAADPIDAALSALDQPAPAANAPQAGDQFDEPTGFIDANVKQFRDLSTRFQAGLASNDNEVMGLLKKKFGQENVRWKDDKAFYRDKPGDKFRPLDPKQFEVFSDLIPDMARGFVQEAVALPFEAGGAAVQGAVGAVAGSAVPVAGTAAGGAAGLTSGAIAGRVASVPFQIMAADYLADLVGVPQDAERSKVTEGLIQGGIEAVAPFVGKMLGAGAKKLVKYVPGTEARATRLAAKEADNVFVLGERSANIRKDAEELTAAGLAPTIRGEQIGYPDADVVLPLTSLHPDHPAAQAAEKELASNARYQNAMKLHAEDWGTAIKDHLGSITTAAKSEGVEDAVPLGKTLVDAATTFKNAEGKAIENYKNQALRASKNQRVPFSPEISDQLVDLTKSLGFKMRAGAEGGMTVLPPKNVNEILGNMGINDPGVARSFVNVMQNLVEKSQNGAGLKMSDMNAVVNLVGGMTPTAGRNGGEIAGKWGALTGALRDYRNQSVMQFLPDETSKKGFQEVMTKYGAIRNGVADLAATVNNDMSRQAIVKTLFNKGKEGLGDVKAIKSLLQQASPAQWESLKGEFVEQLVLKHTKAGPTGLNATGLKRELQQSFGPEFMKVLYDDSPNNFGDLVKLLNVGERLNERKVGAAAMSEAEKTGMIKDVSKLMLASNYIKANGLLSILGVRKGKDSVLMDVLTQDGVDKYVQDLPKNQRVVVSQKFKELVNYARANGMLGKLDEVTNMVPTPMRQVLKRGAPIAAQGLKRGFKQEQKIKAATSNDFSPTNEDVSQ